MTDTLHYDENCSLNFDGIQERLRRIWASISWWKRWLLKKAKVGWDLIWAAVKYLWAKEATKAVVYGALGALLVDFVTGGGLSILKALAWWWLSGQNGVLVLQTETIIHTAHLMLV